MSSDRLAAIAVPAFGGDSPVRSDFPFASSFLTANGAEMHYVECGQGDPILLLHGNPASVYIWRNVIPLLSTKGRVVAVDLVGFGKSGKPDIEYRFKDHAAYLEAFIALQGLKNITLVMHDWGSGLGFDYAARHPDNVHALAFLEALLAPIPALERWPNQHVAEQFRRYRTPGVGWDLIVNQNDFVEKRLQEGIIRRLSDEELHYYREPFKEPKSRKPVWRWPNELPIDGTPHDVAEVQARYVKWLVRTNKPKMLLFASPGALTPDSVVRWARTTLSNLETIDLGPGIHNLQEDHPLEIGHAIATWLDRVNQAQGVHL